jgi:hypothetical protein
LQRLPFKILSTQGQARLMPKPLIFKGGRLRFYCDETLIDLAQKAENFDATLAATPSI